jgi:uncharacterized pyridoxamine 5'-phosphate oxidase family protein
MVNWKTKLDDLGYAYLTKISVSGLSDILSQLGVVINETDVIASTESKSLVTSCKFLDFHTDNHLAKYIVWHCYKPAEEGGYSMLCDGEKVYKMLTENEKQELSKIHVFEHKLFPENKNSNPIVREIEGKRKFYYSYWLAREKHRENPVFKKWGDLVQQSNHIIMKLNKSDVLIIDNHRIFHGRTAISGERYLKRYWLKEITKNKLI